VKVVHGPLIEKHWFRRSIHEHKVHANRTHSLTKQATLGTCFNCITQQRVLRIVKVTL